MTALSFLFDEKKVEAIRDKIGGMRNVFTDIETKNEQGETVVIPALDRAKAAFNAAKALAEPDGIPAYRPMRDVKDEAGNIVGTEPDDSVFENANAVVATVGQRKRANEKKSDSNMVTGIRAIVMFPIPTVEAFLTGGDDASRFIQKIVEKEAAHVAFRHLRNAETLEELESAARRMPTGVEQYVAGSRGEGLDTDAFNDLWAPMKAALTERNMGNFVALLPAKGEALRAIRSKPYALSTPELKPLEEANAFTFIAGVMVKLAAQAKTEAGEPDPIDSTPIQEWLAARDTFELQTRTTAEKDFSVLSGINLDF